jgi:hypothetical protein
LLLGTIISWIAGSHGADAELPIMPPTMAALAKMEANKQEILRLLKEGPQTGHDIELVCNLGKLARAETLRRLEGEGLIEKAVYLIETADGRLNEKPCYRIVQEAA